MTHICFSYHGFEIQYYFTTKIDHQILKGHLVFAIFTILTWLETNFSLSILFENNLKILEIPSFFLLQNTIIGLHTFKKLALKLEEGAVCRSNKRRNWNLLISLKGCCSPRHHLPLLLNCQNENNNV